ncbi:MAG: chemotaxis protein CheV [Gammaproteobacteria bacterium]|nr:chemotaxis protein CheV [Gammaproteobacteria bacterium]MDH5776575.1 chemotaxis protein CheV [Gammaproteobacteria bacterium]
MAGLLDGVDQRTRLAGENRMELLLFTLGSAQKFGINVFKVQEVIQCPSLTRVAHSNPVVRGITNIRGKTIPVMDLAKAIGKEAIENIDESFVIVAEFNQSVQGFLVGGVDRIVNMKWEDIQPPPAGLGKNNFMTAVTKVDDEIVEIVDVEKILADLIQVSVEVSEETAAVTQREARPWRVMIVDDSSVARKQIQRTLEQMHIETVQAKNGKEGLMMLQEMAAETNQITDKIDVVISDVEMPEMDGYTLTIEVRKDDRLKDVPIILHTSLSGQFNLGMVKQVGANSFIPKFGAETLAAEVKSFLTMQDE